MMRRPHGPVVLLALAALLVPCLQVVDARQQHLDQQQHEAQQQQQLRSPPEGDHVVVPNLAATALTNLPVVETPHILDQRKTTVTSRPAGSRNNNDNTNNINININTNNNKNDGGRPRRPARYESTNILIPDDASALNALALDQDSSVRAPALPPHRNSPHDPKGLSPPYARRLEDWEVEDFVLLATVDGDLYASDRKTGKLRWHLEVEQPTVETKHYRADTSVLDDDYSAVDHYIWVVEPDRDGLLYLWVPGGSGAGLIKMPYTMKEMVEELAPHEDPEQDILYTGEKKTTVVTLDAATGQVLKWFGSSGSQVNEMESCAKPNVLTGVGGETECNNGGTITLGRTEYTVGIYHTKGDIIATLKYSEWGPNTFDNDLLQQYLETKDSHYITSRHDGQVYGFDYGRFDQESTARAAFAQKLDSPVARVFDVLRRWEDNPEDNPALTVLPQPPPPAEDDAVWRQRSGNVFINQTSAGSWYALSGARYPLILQAPPARIHANGGEGWDLRQAWDVMDEAQISAALIGTHPLPTGPSSAADAKQTFLTLPDGSAARAGGDGGERDNDSASPTAGMPLPEAGRLLNKIREIAVIKVADLFSNPVAILFFLGLLLYFQGDMRHWYRGKKGPQDAAFDDSQIEVKSTEPSPDPAERRDDLAKAAVSQSDEAKASDEEAASAVKKVEEGVKPKRIPAVLPVVPANESEAKDAPVKPAKEAGPTVTFAEPLKDEERPSDVDGASGLEAGGKKKKGAHRGRRGGIKHKKGKDKQDLSQSRDDDPPQQGVEDLIKDIVDKVGEQPKLEPDIQTMTIDVEEVSGPILKMGSLEVNEDQQLGTGSNGTVVYAGKWDGRDVAVKRMLIQFNEIASQETKLLRESDDHPNVIRYFAQQQRADFLYIALELCQASLADIVQKPDMYAELAHAGQRDLPSILYQIANGLSHLHSLRIVHRDLKPQNILVNMGKDGRPRVLVSDFGLCKKLEGGQSSFGATTAHAAGTSGWRAPELLIDDDAPPGSGSLHADQGSSLHSASGGTGSALVGPELLGPNSRRVTRAIDIFSLGLVFFFVLTRGNHPFDCGDRYMREVNIRKGNYNLQPLDVLGDYAFEARDLIANMLSAQPKHRPSALDVMAHPFFWPAKKRLAFLCDVSDHFEKEVRDPPSPALQELERFAPDVVRSDFLKHLPKEFVDSLGKQRKYTGSRLLDLLRALRNKKNHYEDMTETLKKVVGPLPEGYLGFWTRRFPNLLIVCWGVVYNVQWQETDRFREYYLPAGL